MHNTPLMRREIPTWALMSWCNSVKPTTHYSPLFTNNGKTTFSHKKKNRVSGNMTKSGLHTIFIYRSFCECVATENTAKKVFWIRQKTVYSGECILRKSFLRNAHESDKLLSTHYSHFARISSVRSFFVIVSE